jgi:hypothetical protein
MLCLPYYAYVFSATKLEIRAEQVLSGSKGVGGQRGEMTQTMYIHVNKGIIKRKKTAIIIYHKYMMTYQI